jgi:hypothetical protein
MKHAILKMMESPPPAFREVVEKHFALKKDEIIAQCREWERLAPLDPLAKIETIIDHSETLGVTAWLKCLWNGVVSQYTQVRATTALTKTTRFRKEIEDFHDFLDVDGWLGEEK